MKYEKSDAACGGFRSDSSFLLAMNARCEFQTLAPGLHECRRCGFRVGTPDASDRIHHRCPVPDRRAAGRLKICRACQHFSGPGELAAGRGGCRKLDALCIAQSLWTDILAGVDGDAIGCPEGKF
jgi:hypothetical protein